MVSMKTASRSTIRSSTRSIAAAFSVFCAAPNAAHTIGLAIDRPEVAGGQAYVVADDRQYSFRDWTAMIARLMFPSSHPAIPFLLLLAIADELGLPLDRDVDAHLMHKELTAGLLALAGEGRNETSVPRLPLAGPTTFSGAVATPSRNSM